VNDASAPRGLTLVLLVLLALLPGTAPAATPTAQFWEEIGGSASGQGISASELGVVPEHRNTSIVIDGDGRPVVAYTDWADIIVKRWNGLEWETIATPGGGHLPQLVMDANGKIYLGWQEFVPATNTWELCLLARDPATGDWQELGGSASGECISGADGAANVNSFSLALGPDGSPWVAYDTLPTTSTDFTTQASGLAAGGDQVYVKHWTGATDGWVYVGTGRDGGGATNVQSFVLTNANGSANFVQHGALSPALAVRADGSPVLAFIYTSEFTNGNPPEFNGLNDDIYAVTWNGGAWVPMGPAVPTTAAGAGLGGPGGISNDNGWSVEAFINRMNRPYMIIGRDGAPVLGWGETSDTDGFRRMYVRRWNGTAWQGLGSASGEIAMSSVAFDISLAPGVNGPIAAWSGGGGADVSIYVLGWDSRVGRWSDVGTGSGTGTGVSGTQRRSHTPWITVDPAGTPSVTWIQAPDVWSSGQTFVRAYDPNILPDLVVTALTAPASTRTGGTISVTSTVRNLGVAASPSVPLNFYLSTGTTRGADDVLLGTRTVAALGVNGTSTITASLTLPPSVEPGTYQVLAVVDEGNTVAERNESNNARASAPMTVALFRPELRMAALSMPATGATGRPLAITNTVQNTGIAPAGPFGVRFYLSSDGTLDAGDVLLGSRTMSGLAAGASSNALTTLMVPANTSAPATYQVIAVIDPLGQVELDGTNHMMVSAGSAAISLYRPDLAITTLTMPAAGATGRPLAITNAVRNSGPAPAGAFSIKFYLSTDGNTGDVYLGARTVGSLGAGMTSTAVTTLTVPPATNPGPYHVLAIADALNQVVETNEDNNTAATTETVTISLYRPDLTMTAVSMPATGATGRPLAITNSVRNGGQAPAGAFTIKFYLSTDGTSTDVYLGARAVGSLAAGVTNTAVTTLTVPPATEAGPYYVIAVADALNQQVELEETNNTLASTGTVNITLYRPDLTLTAVSVPVLGAAGRPLVITTTLRNAGPAPVSALAIRFYLSSNDVLDGGDVLLGTRTMGSLGGGASRTDMTTVTIPANTSVPATYQVVAVVDALGQPEMDPNNNSRASAAMNVTAYLPDLLLTSVSAPAGAAAGRSLTVTTITRNAGPAPAGAFSIRFYLSADDHLDGSDVLLGTRAIGSSLAGGTSRTDMTTTTVPAGTVVPPTYYIIGVVDALGQQAELDENNNITASGPLAASSTSSSASAR
jgi:subtilase family serine protease